MSRTDVLIRETAKRTEKAAPITTSRQEASSPYMSVRETAQYLDINTKKVYALVGEGKIPGTKVTGKWLFPRKLVDQWLMENSHGGLPSDRLIVTGADDPLIQLAITQLVNDLQGHACISYSNTSTELGLSLLARQRSDVCGVRWGPSAESKIRHAALMQKHPAHKSWVLVRAFEREQGLILAPGYAIGDIKDVFKADVRWIMRQVGDGTQRHLAELFAEHHIDPGTIHIATRALTDRGAASLLVRNQADVAPGARSTATEFGLEFVSLGWEAYDFALNRGIYFRKLFQKLMQDILAQECRRIAKTLGGYDFNQSGNIVWSD